jgi:hypothetical protein
MAYWAKAIPDYSGFPTTMISAATYMTVINPTISMRMEWMFMTRGYALPYRISNLGMSMPSPQMEKMAMA